MSFYRNLIWFAKGYKEYTKGGYQKAMTKFLQEDLDVDMSNKAIMVTGANSGIGRCVAEAVARKGAAVHLVCRSKERGDIAKNEIIECTGNGKVFLHILDMSNPRDVYSFGRTFENDLHVLVNNAGCMLHDRELNADGLEKNFATNTMGTYLLTIALLPNLSKNSGRVVTVSSGGMLTQALSMDFNSEKLKKFDGTTVYAINKRHQVIMMEELAKENPKVFFSSMHPGWADTPAVRSAMPGFYAKMKNNLRSPEEGADTAIFLAISPSALKFPSGKFFQDRLPVDVHLPLAWTKYTDDEAKEFMTKLDHLAQKFKDSSSVTVEKEAEENP